MEDTVTINRKDYVRLLLRDTELSSLETYGVDNWQGCDNAWEDYRERIKAMIKDGKITQEEYDHS